MLVNEKRWNHLEMFDTRAVHDSRRGAQCSAVESIPGKVSGAWVFRGTRMPVQTVFENLEAGMSAAEITEVFDVTPEEIKAVLHFATESLTKAPALGG